MRKFSLTVLLVSSLVLACSGGGGSGIVAPPPAPPPPPPPPPTCPANSVCMQAQTFNPVELQVVKGTAVNFSNDSGILHHVVFDTPRSTGVDDIGDISSGSIPRTFSVTGTFPFHCTIHGGVGTGMHGQIVVP